MEAWTPVATTLLGYGAQWLFGIKNIPNSVTYMLITVMAVVLYFMGCDCKPEWTSRFFISSAGWVLLITQAIRGMAAMSKNTGAAPQTDSL